MSAGVVFTMLMVVMAAERGQDTAVNNLAVFNVIQHEFFAVSEVPENIAVFVSNCDSPVQSLLYAF